MSITVPPVDKLEQIRIKYSKLTRVNANGFVSCSLVRSPITNDTSCISFGKSSFLEKLQSITSFEDDERTLLKSIQFDVQQTIKRYQERIKEQKSMRNTHQAERSSVQSTNSVQPKEPNKIQHTFSIFQQPKPKPKLNKSTNKTTKTTKTTKTAPTTTKENKKPSTSLTVPNKKPNTTTTIKEINLTKRAITRRKQ